MLWKMSTLDPSYFWAFLKSITFTGIFAVWLPEKERMPRMQKWYGRSSIKSSNSLKLGLHSHKVWHTRLLNE